MIALLFGVILTIIGATISLFDKWKSIGSENRLKNNVIAILTLILAFAGAGFSLYTGRTNIKEKNTSDSLVIIKEQEAKRYRDTLNLLNKKLLDTANTSLKYSRELKDLYAKNSELQEELNGYLKGGGNMIPWMMVMCDDDKVTFTIFNAGKFPMWNVKEKCDEQQLPDIGILPPKLNYRFYTIAISKAEKSRDFYFVVWYNNGKSVQIFVRIKRMYEDERLTNTKVTYFNQAGKEFKHPLTLINHPNKNTKRIPRYDPTFSY